jgi:peptidyl-tRNA hydrolase, PTH1 family
MSSIKLIVGLGNPGREYEATRHNAGAMAISLFARGKRWPLKASRIFKSLISEGRIGEEVIIGCLPQTFMNLSGIAVATLAAKKKISLKNILIIHDDVDLPLGTLRFKTGGSHGGHNGVESVIERLGGRDFARLRIGIGPKPATMDLSDFVLSKFCREELTASAKLIARAVDAIETWVREGCEKSMNAYNRKK